MPPLATPLPTDLGKIIIIHRSVYGCDRNDLGLFHIDASTRGKSHKSSFTIVYSLARVRTRSRASTKKPLGLLCWFPVIAYFLAVQGHSRSLGFARIKSHMISQFLKSPRDRKQHPSYDAPSRAPVRGRASSNLRQT